MERHINTSGIKKISWSNKNLRVYYDNGRLVRYENVPEGLVVGMCQAPSAGGYMNRYIRGEYQYVVESYGESRLGKLEHHKDTTVGLYATDRPERIPLELRHLFFRITYDEANNE